MEIQILTNNQPIIATARMDANAQHYFNALRDKHFPCAINYLKAHLTLFHKLPASETQAIKETISLLNKKFSFQAKGEFPYSLGRGVAIAINSPDLMEIHRELSSIWFKWLTPQDRQTFKPHITIQNKVTAGEAQQLLTSMKNLFTPFCFEINGLDLWRYMDGPWQAVS